MGYFIFFAILVFLYLLFSRSNFLSFKNTLFSKTWRNNYHKQQMDIIRSHQNLNMDQKFNSQKVDKQNEIDRILDKISNSGMKSLNREERSFLDKYSNE